MKITKSNVVVVSQDKETIDTTVCAIYTRQSSNSRSDLTSCQVQFEACEAFIRAHKHNGWRWIEEHSNDEGWSGATLDRPALQCLLAKIRNGEIDRRIMSTSTTRHGNKIYRYYRCRSMNAGRSPCRKTQVSAGQIEKEVCQILADLPKRVQEIPLTDRMRLNFQRFSTAWSLLSSEAVFAPELLTSQ